MQHIFKKYLVLWAWLLITNALSFAQDNRIAIYNGQKIFSSGMNMAWGSGFAGNAVNPDFDEFTLALEEIHNAGGNSMRWWLHINGTSSPQYTNDTVSGITQNELDNIRKILDLAFERQMVICISLWSHDMLNGSAGAMVAVNKRMIEDSEASMAYINNALIPLVKAVKGHPGLLAWEIFNEPEGMINGYGWTGNSSGGAWTTYPDIKKFTNLCTGAIHRTDADAMVTTGTHKATYLAHHYTDSVLIQAGGDSLGTLDFFQAHYYSNFGNFQSPFTHPYSYWGIDKPLVIGEFSAHGPNGPNGSPTPQQAYQYLYDNGYAGAWSWTWTGHDDNGDVNDAAEGMLPLAQNYPQDIIIKLPPGFFEEFVIDTLRIVNSDSIKVRWVASDSSVVTFNDNVYNIVDSLYLAPDSTRNYTFFAKGTTYNDSVSFTVTVLQLGNIERFYADRLVIAPGDSVLLRWSVVGGDCCSIVTLNGNSVGGIDSLFVKPLQNSTFTLATDGPTPDTASISITVEEPFTYFEAEDAVTTGEAQIGSNPLNSGGAFVDLRADWTITWNNIIVPDSGDYALRIGYRLTYDSPKSQYFVVNGDTVMEVEFTAPNTSVWLQKDITVSLVKGPNTLAFHGFWNWMSFDYIAVQGAIITSVQEEQGGLPEKLSLSQNYPNPFNSSTIIEFALMKNEKVTVTIYNTLGMEIKTLFTGNASSGLTSIAWHGLNNAGNKVSSGVYFYRLKTESGYIKTRKMILMK